MSAIDAVREELKEKQAEVAALQAKYQDIFDAARTARKVVYDVKEEALRLVRALAELERGE